MSTAENLLLKEIKEKKILFTFFPLKESPGFRCSNAKTADWVEIANLPHLNSSFVFRNSNVSYLSEGSSQWEP